MIFLFSKRPTSRNIWKVRNHFRKANAGPRPALLTKVYQQKAGWETCEPETAFKLVEAPNASKAFELARNPQYKFRDTPDETVMMSNMAKVDMNQAIAML